jgi:hypothetical protein
MIEDYPFTAQAMMNRDWRVVANETSFEAAKREAIRSARLPARVVHHGETIWERWAQSGEWYAPEFAKFKDVAA